MRRSHAGTIRGLAVLPALAAGTGARAQECTARVLLPVTDDLGNAWRPGATLPVDIARDGPDGGFLCAGGGSCIPRRRGGASSLALLDCRPGPTIAPGDRRLVADARIAGAGFARRLRARDAAERRLGALGFSNAAAGSLADDYVDRPASDTAALVRRALEGSAGAVARLRALGP